MDWDIDDVGEGAYEKEGNKEKIFHENLESGF